MQGEVASRMSHTRKTEKVAAMHTQCSGAGSLVQAVHHRHACLHTRIIAQSEPHGTEFQRRGAQTAYLARTSNPNQERPRMWKTLLPRHSVL